jgi:hypothetical protein
MIHAVCRLATQMGHADVEAFELKTVRASTIRRRGRWHAQLSGVNVAKICGIERTSPLSMPSASRRSLCAPQATAVTHQKYSTAVTASR